LLFVKLFDGYVGRYELATNFILTISRDGDRLFLGPGERRQIPIRDSVQLSVVPDREPSALGPATT
jgi:hypothetical protein